MTEQEKFDNLKKILSESNKNLEKIENNQSSGDNFLKDINMPDKVEEQKYFYGVKYKDENNQSVEFFRLFKTLDEVEEYFK